jgi:hypothetical protein
VLQITNWYKAVVAVAAATFVGTVVAGRDTIALISLGVFIFGLGVWKNHQKAIEFRHAPGGYLAKKTDIVHKTTWGGVLLLVVGTAVLICGFFLALGFDLTYLTRLIENGSL